MTTDKRRERRAAGRSGGVIKRTLRIGGWAVVWLLLALTGWIFGNWLRMLAAEDRTPQQAAGPLGRWVQAHDTRLHVVEHGRADAPALVLVAGTGAWTGTWVSNVDAMVQAGWRVVAVDLPPFGFSERPANHAYGRGDQAQRLLAAIRSLGKGPVVLLGHSYGGGPAAEAAMLDPSLVRQLILVDAAIGLRPDNAPCESGGAAAAALSWRPLRTALLATTATQPLHTQFFLRKFVSRQEVVTKERAAIYQVPLKVQGTSAAMGDWAYQFAAVCENARSQTPGGFAALKPPLTLLWGDQDTVTPPQQARDIAAAAPQSRLVMIPGVGHIPQIEDPALFNQHLAEVLSGLK